MTRLFEQGAHITRSGMCACDDALRHVTWPRPISTLGFEPQWLFSATLAIAPDLISFDYFSNGLSTKSMATT